MITSAAPSLYQFRWDISSKSDIKMVITDRELTVAAQRPDPIPGVSRNSEHPR